MHEPDITDTLTSDMHSIAAAAEEQARADLYGLIACLLLAPPDAGLLSALAAADALPASDAESPLDAAWEKLLIAATVMDARAVKEEYDALFISAGTPLLNPYESLYVAGRMMEKPLAALRQDLQRLGLARRPGAYELEDHLGSLCETMRILIVEGRTLPEQRHFFDRHLNPWCQRCLDDIRNAAGANFYRRLADFADAFLRIEAEAFDIEENTMTTGDPS